MSKQKSSIYTSLINSKSHQTLNSPSIVLYFFSLHYCKLKKKRMWCFQFVFALITNLSERKVPLNNYNVNFRSWFELFEVKYKDFLKVGQKIAIFKIYETIKNNFDDFVIKFNNQIGIKEFSDIMNEHGQDWFDINEYGGDADEAINFLANIFQIAVTNTITTKMFNWFATYASKLNKPHVLVDIVIWLKEIREGFEEESGRRFHDYDYSSDKIHMYPVLYEMVLMLERLSCDKQKYGFMINIETFIKEARQNQHCFSLFHEEVWESAMTLMIEAFKKAEKYVTWLDILVQKEMVRSSDNINFDVNLETWTRTHWDGVLSDSEIGYEVEEEKERFQDKVLLRHLNGNYCVTLNSMADYLEEKGIAVRAETTNLL